MLSIVRQLAVLQSCCACRLCAGVLVGRIVAVLLLQLPRASSCSASQRQSLCELRRHRRVSELVAAAAAALPCKVMLKHAASSGAAACCPPAWQLGMLHAALTIATCIQVLYCGTDMPHSRGSLALGSVARRLSALWRRARQALHRHRSRGGPDWLWTALRQVARYVLQQHVCWAGRRRGARQTLMLLIGCASFTLALRPNVSRAL